MDQALAWPMIKVFILMLALGGNGSWTVVPGFYATDKDCDEAKQAHLKQVFENGLASCVPTNVLSDLRFEGQENEAR